MLIPNGNGTFVAGPFDVLCILHGPSGRFHAAVFTDRPFPGPYPTTFEEVDVVRLQSQMHHTDGAATLEVALMQVAELTKKIAFLPTNIWLKPFPWDGTQGFCWTVKNWLKDPLKAINDLDAALKDPAAFMVALKRDLPSSASATDHG